MNFLDFDVFQIVLDLELQKALRLQYGVAIICMAIDVPTEQMLDALKRGADTAIGQLRATDVVTMLNEAYLAIMLVDPDAKNIPRVLQRVVDACRTIPIFRNGEKHPFLWSAGVSLYPQTSTTGEVLRHALTMMEKARRDGGERAYLYGSI